MAFHVYVITQVQSGKTYVGTTSDPVQCRREHQGLHRAAPAALERAMASRGAQAFTFRVVQECDTEEAAARAAARRITRHGSNNPAFGFNPHPRSAGSGGEARQAELACLAAEQARDAGEDETGLRTTVAG